MTSTTRSGIGPTRRLGNTALDAVLIVFGALMLLPLIWLVVSSLTPSRDALATPPNWFPWPLTVENYAAIGDLIPIGRMALNSLIISVLGTLGSLLTSSLAAYGFSRLRFPGRDRIFYIMLAALMVPAQITIIPLFLMMKNLGLVDTLPAVWLPMLINIFAIFFLRQYFASIPFELDEAAKLDGARHWWILFRVILPLSKPALVTIAILVFEASWNGFFWPLIFLNSPENMTLPIGLAFLQDVKGSAPGVVVLAAIAAVVAPLLIAFMFFQRSFVSSIASSGLK